MAEINEEKIYQALGMQMPEGEKEQDVADPAEKEKEAVTGGKERDIAGPAGKDGLESGDSGKEPGNDEEPERTELSVEQRRENAARRRREETEKAVSEAVAKAVSEEREKHQKEMERFFADAGLKNSKTGKPITNMSEFAQWKESFDAERLENDLKAGKLTQEMLMDMVSRHPMIQKAQELIENAKKEEALRLEQQEREMVESEIGKIGKIDPNIRSIEDILKMPTADAFRAAVDRGLSFLDAYKLANWDAITQRAVDAEKQRLINNARGKEHLTPDGTARGSGALTVPADEMWYFRLLNPQASDAQIQEFYNKYHK